MKNIEEVNDAIYQLKGVATTLRMADDEHFFHVRLMLMMLTWVTGEVLPEWLLSKDLPVFEDLLDEFKAAQKKERAVVQ